MNVTGLHWWSVNIGLGNGLVPSGNNPLPEPMLTQNSCCHMASLGQWVIGVIALVLPRAGVKYVLSNTNTNTNTFFLGVSNTNTNTNTPVKIWSNTNTNTNTAHQIQIQIQIHTEAETKLPPFYRWHIQIHCTVRRLFQISLKIVSKGPIYHKPPLAPIMAWHWVGNKPLSDLWWPSVLMHKCITQPKWVNVKCSVADCYLNVV